MPLRHFVRMAITPQQFCSIETVVNLFARDGITKTAAWRKQDELDLGNFADAGTFPLLTRRCRWGAEGFVQPSLKKET
jgi:hypothetical protein